MDISQIERLKKDIAQSVKSLNLTSAEKTRDELIEKSKQKDFWKNNKEAAALMQELADLEQHIAIWRSLEKDINDLEELSKLNDQGLAEDLAGQLSGVKRRYKEMINEQSFSGPYDKGNAIISVFAGAGGTDAQDWSSMLLRMYLRWCEANKYKTKIFDESAGDEAGIKSVSFAVNGPNAYGRLRGENGVHRLVRLSPFNAKNLRQTSFARVEVLPEIDRPGDIPLDEKDLKTDVFRAGGHGGQSVNTTDSAVRITHKPTGIAVSIQNERSQIQNKETALKILRSKLAKLQMEQHKKTMKDLKGPNKSAEWGNQIRSYVLHPYKQVKDLRTRYETSDTQAVLDGDINSFLSAYAGYSIKS